VADTVHVTLVQRCYCVADTVYVTLVQRCYCVADTVYVTLSHRCYCYGWNSSSVRGRQRRYVRTAVVQRQSPTLSIINLHCILLHVFVVIIITQSIRYLGTITECFMQKSDYGCGLRVLTGGWCLKGCCWRVFPQGVDLLNFCAPCCAHTAEFLFLMNLCATAVRKYRYHLDVRYNAARSLRYASRRGFVLCAFKTDYLSQFAIIMGPW
jgi:hypothetical protein